MTDEAKRLKNEYYKNWRKQNKDKTKQYVEKFWERKAQESKKLN